MNTPGRGLAWHDDILDEVIGRLGGDPDGMAVAVGPDNPARHVVRHFGDLLRNRRRLTPAELERIEAVGGVRAAAGLPVDDILHDLRSAMTAAWRYLVSLVPTAFPPSALLEAVGRLAEEALVFAQQAGEAVARGHAAASRLGALGRGRPSVVDPFESEAELGHALGAGQRHGLVVFTLPAAAGDDSRPLAAAVRAFGSRIHAVGGIIRPVPAVHAPVAVAGDEGSWDRVLDTAQAVAADHGAVVLAAAPCQGVRSVYDAYTEIAALVAVARDFGRGGRADDLSVYRFVAGAGAAETRAFVRRVLGGLLDLPADEVTTLVERLDVDPTARRRVEQVTGLTLDQPFDRLRLDTALVLRRHDWVPPSA